MTFSRTATALLLAAITAFSLPVPVLTQTCAQVVENLQTRTAALNNEATTNSANFLRDELVGPALGSAKRVLEGDPTAAAYNQVQDAREKAQAWIDRLNSFDAFFQRLKQCGETNCNMFEFIKEENARSRLAESVQEKLNEWVQSLGDNGVTAAAERVNKISSIVKNAVSGAQGIAQDGITGAVSCMGQYMQTAEAAQADPVDPTSTPAGTAPAGRSGGGGSGIGKILGWTAVLAGGAVGGAYLYEQAQLLAEESYTTTPTGNVSQVTPSNTPSTFTLGGFSCTAANSTSNLRTCTGSINIRAGSLIGARQGSSLTVLTSPTFFSGTFIAPATGGTTGTVSLRATIVGCPTQTHVNFAVPGGQPFESIAASIRLTCP